MGNSSLICHADTAPLMVRSLSVDVIALGKRGLSLRWRIEGAAAVVWPEPAGCERRDGLWQTSCFELFLQSEGKDGYSEYNFSPSGHWAAYDFSAYRAGMCERPLASAPEAVLYGQGDDVAIFDVTLKMSALPRLPAEMGLSAVLEEQGGRISYWALAHPSGKADFHHRACLHERLAAGDVA